MATRLDELSSALNAQRLSEQLLLAWRQCGEKIAILRAMHDHHWRQGIEQGSGRPWQCRDREARGARLLAAAVGCAVAVLLLHTGCALAPETSRTGKVHEIKVGEQITPMELVVRVGDEIRWLNLRSVPVHVGILNATSLRDVSCAKNFRRFGLVQDFVTIQPLQSASLCFEVAGSVQFNVWFDVNNLRGNISRTAKIWVLGAS
ncbi:MAG: hypothetical protein ACKOCD_00040 [Nitrospiraceae bacterium]